MDFSRPDLTQTKTANPQSYTSRFDEKNASLFPRYIRNVRDGSMPIIANNFGGTSIRAQAVSSSPPRKIPDYVPYLKINQNTDMMPYQFNPDFAIIQTPKKFPERNFVVPPRANFQPEQQIEYPHTFYPFPRFGQIAQKKPEKPLSDLIQERMQPRRKAAPYLSAMHDFGGIPDLINRKINFITKQKQWNNLCIIVN